MRNNLFVAEPVFLGWIQVQGPVDVLYINLPGTFYFIKFTFLAGWKQEKLRFMHST